MSTIRQLIQERLDEAIRSGRIKTIHGVEGAGPLFQETPAPQPGRAYIARIERKAGPNRLLGRHVAQDVLETFAVYVVAANVATQTGADSSDEIEAMGDEARGVLLGWAPVADGDVLAYAGGKLIEQKAAWLVWAEFYSLVKQI